MPFFGGLSVYKIIGTNVDGGNDTLPVNHGNNNIGIGNAVLQNNDTGDRNIGIGNLSLNANVENSNNIGIGYSALFSSQNIVSVIGIGNNVLLTGDGNSSVVIGTNTMPTGNANGSVIVGFAEGDHELSVNIGTNPIGSDQGLDNSIILGSNDIDASVGQIANSIIIGTANQIQTESGEIDNNIIIANNLHFSSSFGVHYDNNIIIGRNFDSGEIETLSESIFIGNNITGSVILDGLKQVQIGDPDISYDQIMIGDLLITGGGGGGFEAEATQDAEISPVSITSTSLDNTTVGNQVTAEYIFSAISDTAGENVTSNLVADVFDQDGNYATFSANSQMNESGSQQVEFEMAVANSDGTINNNIESIVDLTQVNTTLNSKDANTKLDQHTISTSGAYSDSILETNYEGSASLILNGSSDAGTGLASIQSSFEVAQITTGWDSGEGASSRMEFNSEPSTASTLFSFLNGDDTCSLTNNVSETSIITVKESTNGTDTITLTESFNLTDGLLTEANCSAEYLTKEFFISTSDGTLSFDAVGGNAEISTDSELYLSGATLRIVSGDGVIGFDISGETGSDTASFVNANAPAVLTITNWIPCTLNGVSGYIPFMSA